MTDHSKYNHYEKILMQTSQIFFNKV